MRQLSPCKCLLLIVFLLFYICPPLFKRLFFVFQVYLFTDHGGYHDPLPAFSLFFFQKHYLLSVCPVYRFVESGQILVVRWWVFTIVLFVAPIIDQSVIL